jgi:hypothetical protein
MKLKSVTLKEATKRPGKSPGWGNLNTALFTNRTDTNGGAFDIDYDVESQLVTVSRGGEEFSVHVSMTRELVREPEGVAQGAPNPVDPTQVAIAASKPKNAGLAAMQAKQAKAV